jgi:hypothetical protein
MAIRSCCVICGEITSAPDRTCTVCDPERRATAAQSAHEAREILEFPRYDPRDDFTEADEEREIDRQLSGRWEK